MNVTLRPELKDAVAQMVQDGTFHSTEEAVNHAVEILADQRRFIANHLPALREAVAQGVAELDAGEGEPWDSEEIKREGRRLLAARRRKSQS